MSKEVPVKKVCSNLNNTLFGPVHGDSPHLSTVAHSALAGGIYTKASESTLLKVILVN